MIDFAFRKKLHAASGPIELDIATSLDDRSFVTLFGPSGAGKTTMLRMLAGLTVPDAGRLIVDGTTWFDAAARINLPPQQRSIGVVFQDYALFPHWTVRKNIAYALQKGQDKWLDELLDLAALRELQHRLPATLSGGQKQRVALVRALARKPRLLLLDEPLSALDADLRVQLQEQLLALHKRFDVTTLLVTHDVGEVFKLAQRVLRIDQGRLVQSGTPAELFLHKRLTGKINLRAQVLAIRHEDVVFVVSLLLGQQVIDVIADPDEVHSLQVGDMVSLSAKSFSPLLFK